MSTTHSLSTLTPNIPFYYFSCQPSLMDLAIVLILTSNIGSLKLRARELLTVWLKQGTFPYYKLELILELHRSNEVKPYNNSMPLY